MKYLAILIILLAFNTPLFAAPGDIFIDGETLATGSDLGNNPLVTAAGTITFTGDILTLTDTDATLAGSAGNIFDGAGSSPAIASFSFDFDVCAFNFVYGGNGGNITVEARDAGNAVINSFFQADTGSGQAAGPQSLIAANTRVLEWRDTNGSFVFLDNITVTPCNAVPSLSAQKIPSLSPVSSITLVLILGLFGVIIIRRR